MPQMAPYSWLMLMMMFSMIFIIFNSFLYFFINKNFNSKINKIKLLKFINKW